LRSTLKAEARRQFPMPVHKRAVHLVISAGFYALVCLRNLLAWMFGIGLHRSSIILYYHVVAREHRSRFAAQLDALLHWAVPVRADLNGPVDVTLKHVAITFDDISETVVHNAFPELQRRSIPITIFVCSGLLGQEVGWE